MSAQPLLEWFDVTSSSKKLAVLLVMLGALTVLMYVIVIGPRLNEVIALQHEVQQLDQVLTTRNDYGEQRTRLTTEVSVLRKRYQTLSEAVGIFLAVPDVLSDISRAANQAGVSLMLWKPEPAAPVQGHAVSGPAARLEVEGNYHGLARFLNELARLPKALAVKAFSITALQGDQKQDTIQASVDLLGYESSDFLSLVPAQTDSGARFPIHEGK